MDGSGGLNGDLNLQSRSEAQCHENKFSYRHSGFAHGGHGNCLKYQQNGPGCCILQFISIHFAPNKKLTPEAQVLLAYQNLGQ